MKKIIIFGAGGNSRDIIELIQDINRAGKEKYNCFGILDDDKSLLGKKVLGVKIIGSIDTANSFSDCYFINGIYTLNNFSFNKDVIKKSKISDELFKTLIHPSARISESAVIGNGCIIMPGSVILSNVVIGNHVNIQAGAVISHDSIIGSYSFFACNATTGGFVNIGESCFVGLNSTIKEKITVGKNSVIGMGSVVLENIPDGSVYVGNPAKFLRKEG